MTGNINCALQLATNDAQTFLAAAAINASVVFGPPAHLLSPAGAGWADLLARRQQQARGSKGRQQQARTGQR